MDFRTVLGLALALVAGAHASPSVAFAADPAPSAEEARAIGVEAYVYGYPLVTMEMTRRVMTNAAMPGGNHAPMGQFHHSKTYPDAKFRDVTAPNADTLYSTAWVDLSKEPYVLGLPDAKDRYYLFPMLDGWTDVFQVPGKRTTGTGAQTYALTGPNWKGTLPTGVTEYKSPTALVWILGRVYCTGTPEDYAAVHDFQAHVTLVPLSAYGKPYTAAAGTVDASVDMKTAVRTQVHAMTASAYFALLSDLWKTNPPTPQDAPLVAKMAKIGLVPGKSCDLTGVGPELAKALEDVPKAAQAAIMGHYKEAGSEINGWIFSTKTGLYGTDYLQRAFITAIGLGANRPQDAVYPSAKVDAEGKPLDGSHTYVLHFDKGQTPPAEGFWSLTMYDDEFFFVENPLNRYTLSSRFDFKFNDDGSLDLQVQHDSPGKDRESNWLPAPSGGFNLMLRLYWPRAAAPSIIDGTWKLPAVQRVK